MPLETGAQKSSARLGAVQSVDELSPAELAR